MHDPPHDSLPHGMRALGAAGVLPFVVLPLLAMLQPSLRGFALAAFVAYGAVILSFLGGSRWGRALAGGAPASRPLEAVLPSLLGFAALLLAYRPVPALSLLAAGFAMCCWLDLRDPLWSPAYRRLRLAITAGVVPLHAAWLWI